MKLIPFLLVFGLYISCKKKADLGDSNLPGQKLYSISSDSAGNNILEYTADSVSTIYSGMGVYPDTISQIPNH